MWSFGSIIPKGIFCVLYAIRRKVYWGLTHCVFFLWFDITHTKAHHTQRPIDWHTHINIYKHHLLYAYSNYLYYTYWIICWYQKFTFLNSGEFYKNYALVEVTYLLIRFTKTKLYKVTKLYKSLRYI